MENYLTEFKKKPLIAIALSGGVDSLVAAHLLKEQGYPLVGIHFLTGYDHSDTAQLRHIAAQLGIDLEIADIRKEFDEKVVAYFTQTYRECRTPNPCLICNPMIKFKTIADIARKLGAAYLATGHYARIIRTEKYHLHKGLDSLKDQSYFLAFLSQEQLSYACFPLGNMSKQTVKKIAEEKGLMPIHKTESQDICFIRGKSYGDFLEDHGFKPEPGTILTTNGKIIGKHQGLHRFTIGQRKGINCPASEPYYVVKIDRTDNRLIVGFKPDLLSSECKVAKIHWMNEKPDFPIEVHTRVRYRHHAAPSVILPLDETQVIVRFHVPQEAVTPGQGAVFYYGDEVIGGGFIEEVYA
ncbi:MAG TPA: tRNA 2-thiouridine(34) synthase MnmA [Desulfobacteraceae bacterium]|nr:tRNA 2-thiouridine(34) synthase MnmA [Desulfobacteraceae bacterium]